MDVIKRAQKEKRFARDMVAAWSLFALPALKGQEPNWDKFAAVSEKAARDHIEAQRRLAIVLIFLLFADSIDAGKLSETPEEYARRLAEETRLSGRPKRLGQMLAKTSRGRWNELRTQPTRAELEQWVEDNLTLERGEMVAATEITLANTDGEFRGRDILQRLGVGLRGIWRAEPDRCDVCGAVDGTDEMVWRRYFPSGPPEPHTKCRCHIHWVLDN